jgi:hypothetical protein
MTECEHSLTMVIYPDRTMLECVRNGCDYEEPYEDLDRENERKGPE